MISGGIIDDQPTLRSSLVNVNTNDYLKGPSFELVRPFHMFAVLLK